MFNLTVDEAHTFYVGNNGWLVHNCPDVAELLWTSHGFKHVAQKNMSWKDIIGTTKKGPAKYIPGTDIEALERAAWESGTPVTNGKTWKVMEYDSVVGASEGMEVRWVRVEFSGNTIHGHPITQAEYKKLLKPR